MEFEFDREKLLHNIKADREKQAAENADQIAALPGIEGAIRKTLAILAADLDERAIKQATTHLLFALCNIRRLLSESDDRPESL